MRNFRAVATLTVITVVVVIGIAVGVGSGPSNTPHMNGAVSDTVGSSVVALAGEGETLRVLPIGDSITEGLENNGIYVGAWTDSFADELELAGTHVELLGSMQRPGVTGTRHEGHAGWCLRDTPRWCWGTTGPNQGMLEHVDGWLEMAGHADLIVLQGGINDFASSSQHPELTLDPNESIKLLYDRVRRSRPGVPIVLVSISFPAMSTGPAGERYRTYNETLQAIASKNENTIYVPVPDLANPRFMADDVHPNTDGYRLLGVAIAQTLLTHVGIDNPRMP